MREISFPLISLGSSAMKKIEIKDIVSWIHEKKGNIVDIISFQLDYLYTIQKGIVPNPVAGGDFYGNRINEILGIDNNRVVQELSIDFGGIISDLQYIPKNSAFSLPSLSQLELTNEYYSNIDDFQEEGVKLFKRLCREFKDNGVSSIIVHSECPTPIEFEVICGKKYLWWVPREYRENLLEMTHNLILPFDEVNDLESLIDSYNIQKLFLYNATEESLQLALDYLDKENIYVSGYAPAINQVEYWKKLSNLKIYQIINKK